MYVCINVAYIPLPETDNRPQFKKTKTLVNIQ